MYDNSNLIVQRSVVYCVWLFKLCRFNAVCGGYSVTRTESWGRAVFSLKTGGQPI